VVFFSLCGLLNWKDAVTSTVRNSTCAIFLRASLVASGCINRTDWTEQCGGVFEYLGIPPAPGNTATSVKGTKQRTILRVGDIFHLANAVGKEDHVGLITSIEPYDSGRNAYVVETVEGGQRGGLATERFLRGRKEFRYNGDRYYMYYHKEDKRIFEQQKLVYNIINPDKY